MTFVLSGPVRGGKTTLLERSLPRWALRGLACCGILSPAVTDPNGSQGYDLVEIKTGRRYPYLRREGGPEAERTGPFFFIPETLELARTIVRGADSRELLVVDEIGPLELRGGGIWPALREVIAEPARRSLLVVREQILEGFVAVLGPRTPLVFDVRDPNVERFMDGYLFGTAGSDDR